MGAVREMLRLPLPAARRVVPHLGQASGSNARRSIVIDRASFSAEELRRAPKTGQRMEAAHASHAGAPIPKLRRPMPGISMALGGSEDMALKEKMVEMSRELEWTRERLMMLTEEASQAASSAPVDTVPRDVYKQLEADVQKLQQQNIRMHLAEQGARSSVADALAEVEALRTQLAATEHRRTPAGGNMTSQRLECELSLAVSARDEAMAGIRALEEHVAELTSALEAAVAARPARAKTKSDDSTAATLEMSLDLLKSSWIDTEFRGMGFREIADAKIEILAGVGGKTAEALHTIGVSTVRDLATLPAYLNAMKADPSDAAAMDQPVESVVDPSLTPELRKIQQAGLRVLRIRTVGEMRNYKFAGWARAILDLAARS